jgi:ribonucleoside-diphosphate reductase alpha chain
MLSMLFETGHPWITFKDPCNLRSPQQHVGVVHSSNLCTEITLNTSKDEIAVCNLGSVNLAQHVDDTAGPGQAAGTVRTAVRMLDNVIDINYYSVPQARNSNLKHRPVGLGIMGFQDALYKQHLPTPPTQRWSSPTAPWRRSAITPSRPPANWPPSAAATRASRARCGARASCPSIPSALLQRERGEKYIAMWITADPGLGRPARRKVKQRGMRNSNVMAIAPTATIANICGVSQSIEPTYQNLYVKSNLSGEFTVVNPYLVSDLKARACGTR